MVGQAHEGEQDLAAMLSEDTGEDPILSENRHDVNMPWLAGVKRLRHGKHDAKKLRLGRHDVNGLRRLTVLRLPHREI